LRQPRAPGHDPPQHRPLLDLLVVLVGALPTLGPARAAEPDLAAQCAQARDDDTVRPYAPELREGLLKAYTGLFPRARMPPEQSQLQATANIRCMDGCLLACFTGANLALFEAQHHAH
jgi:hypothetical protein